MAKSESNYSSEGNASRYYGLTPPLSLAEPTEADVVNNLNLQKLMVDYGLYESNEDSIKKEQVLGCIDQIVKAWVKQLSRQKGYPVQIVEDAKAIIFTFGSYCLGIHSPQEEIEVLCVGPSYVNREEDFLIILHNVLVETEEVTEIQTVPIAEVPMLKFKLSGISIHLLYAGVSLLNIPKNLDITDASILYNVDEPTLRSLSKCRNAIQIIGLVPNVEYFRMTLRCMMFWARRQGIYSHNMGFLGGDSWAILVAHLCQLYPNAVPSMLVSQFFRLYTQWRWPSPVFLSPIEDRENGLPAWDPRTDCMPIITPAYPCMNSGCNVSTGTLHVMLRIFQENNKICEQIQVNEVRWDALFEPIHFFEMYKNYLQIDIVAANADDMSRWKDWVETQLMQLGTKIERDTSGMLLCHPYPIEYSDPTKQSSNRAFYIGLQRKHGDAVGIQEKRQFDIRGTVEEFRSMVLMYMFWEPGMDMCVSCPKKGYSLLCETCRWHLRTIKKLKLLLENKEREIQY